MLQDRNAVIHGAGGVIGGAVARAFAREGATVFLAGPTPATLDAVGPSCSPPWRRPGTWRRTGRA